MGNGSGSKLFFFKFCLHIFVYVANFYQTSGCFRSGGDGSGTMPPQIFDELLLSFLRNLGKGELFLNFKFSPRYFVIYGH